MGDDTSNVNSARLFALIQALHIKGITLKAIQNFLVERENYEDAILAQLGIQAVPLRAVFKPTYLKSLVRAEVFGEEISSVTQLNDGTLQEKLLALSGAFVSVSCEEAQAESKRVLRLNADIKNADIRIKALSAAYLDLSEKNGWKFVDKSQKKLFDKLLLCFNRMCSKTRLKTI